MTIYIVLNDYIYVIWCISDLLGCALAIDWVDWVFLTSAKIVNKQQKTGEHVENQNFNLVSD